MSALCAIKLSIAELSSGGLEEALTHGVDVSADGGG